MCRMPAHHSILVRSANEPGLLPIVSAQVLVFDYTWFELESLMHGGHI